MPLQPQTRRRLQAPLLPPQFCGILAPSILHTYEVSYGLLQFLRCDPGCRTKFCNKCDSTVSAPVPLADSSFCSAYKGGSSALKVILIVVAVVVSIGIIGVVTVGIVGYRIAKSSRVSQHGDHVKVDTPFGSVETSKDPDQAAKDLGIELYPGAEVQKQWRIFRDFRNPHRHRQYSKATIRPRQSLQLLQIQSSPAPR